ncbi:MAG: GtrA family protein [Akkermansia sp.]
MLPFQKKISRFFTKNNSIFKFIVVGIASSIVHWCISWWMYYHVIIGMTILATLSGYSGGLLCSYIGNRTWSFKDNAAKTSIKGSAFRFILSQLIASLLLLVSTWIAQQLIIFYFSWYILTNHLVETKSLINFYQGASYPPALLTGMIIAALASYFMTRFFVFKKFTTKSNSL